MADRPRNLIFICSDQQRFDSISCYGADYLERGALHDLASRSFVFDHCYCTQPVCTPSRSTLITGLYPHAAGMQKNNIVIDPEIPSLADMAGDAFYRPYYGKWHLGNETTRQAGFDEWLPVADLPWRIDHPDTPYHRFLAENGVKPDTDGPKGRVYSPKMRATLPEPLTQASFLGAEAARFIRDESGKHEPFLLSVHFMEPHNPYEGPLDDLYDPEALPVGPAFLEQPEGVSLFNRVRAAFYDQPEGPHSKMGSFGDADTPPRQRWRILRAQYYANVTLVDRAVGMIMDALAESGRADDTAVIFTSDHGEMAGDHALLEKRAFYEESAKVPLLMHIPWLSHEQVRIPGNFSQIDLVPTMLDMLGRPVPDHLQGRSRLPVLRGEDDLADNVAFIQWDGSGDRDLGDADANLLGTVPRRCLVSADRFKLALCAGDQGELFDLNADPHETTNLFDEPAHRDRVRLMAARIRLWQQETGDPAPLPAV